MSEERRESVYVEIGSLRDRITRLEALRESDDKGQAMMATQLIELTKAITKLSLQVNTIETQRNTVIGAAAFIGALVTAVAQWVFRLMVGPKT